MTIKKSKRQLGQLLGQRVSHKIEEVEMMKEVEDNQPVDVILLLLPLLVFLCIVVFIIIIAVTSTFSSI
jgi:hypothetical protein